MLKTWCCFHFDLARVPLISCLASMPFLFVVFNIRLKWCLWFHAEGRIFPWMSPMMPTVCRRCCIVPIPPMLSGSWSVLCWMMVVPLMRMAASAVARVTLSLLDDEVWMLRMPGHSVGWRWGMVAMKACMRGAELARVVRRLPRLLLAVRFMRGAFRAFVVRVGVCWCWIRRLVFLGARLVFPQVRLVSGCRLRSRVCAGFACGARCYDEVGVAGALRGVAGRWLRLWVWMACCRTSLRCRTMTLPLICRWWWPSMRRRVWC